MTRAFRHLLAIDASTSRASVALWSSEVLWEEQIDATALQAQLMLPLIDSLLQRANLTPGQLDGIVLGRGPGSFTGLRIACSIAKGLAYAHDLPIYPVSDLAVIAHQMNQKKGDAPVLSLMDARMNQLYWAYYEHPSNSLDVDEQVTAAELIVVPDKPFYLAGVGFEAYKALLPQAIFNQILGIEEIYPCARALISWAQSCEFSSLDALHVSPVYIRHHVTHGAVNG